MSSNLLLKEDILRFGEYEVRGVVDTGEACVIVNDDANAQFFSIYGRTDPEGHAYCIGDFSTREGAEIIVEAIKRSRNP